MRAVFTREKSKVALFMAHDVQLATHQPFFRSLVGKSRSLFSLSEKKWENARFLGSIKKIKSLLKVLQNTTGDYFFVTLCVD